MGSNMQRQAVPLIKREKAILQTGLEKYIAQSSNSTIFAKNSGQIKFKSCNKIIIEERSNTITPQNMNFSLSNKIIKRAKLISNKNYCNTKKRTYKLEKPKKSNQNTIISNSPIVEENQWVKRGEIIADGAATHNGEITLGRNLLIGYIGWEGYNFEDAVVINRRLIDEDILTSLHIKKYKTFLINDNIGEVRTKKYHLKRR